MVIGVVIITIFSFFFLLLRCLLDNSQSGCLQKTKKLIVKNYLILPTILILLLCGLYQKLLFVCIVPRFFIVFLFVFLFVFF